MPLIDLLDDLVDLTPAPHRPTGPRPLCGIPGSLRRAARGLDALAQTLPALAEGDRDLGGAQLRVGELIDNGLVEVAGDKLRSTSDQLDTDFLNGFLRSAANIRRSTSASGVFRTDARAVRILQMDVAEQRRYGAVFRTLDEFEQQTKRVAELVSQVVRLA